MYCNSCGSRLNSIKKKYKIAVEQNFIDKNAAAPSLEFVLATLKNWSI